MFELERSEIKPNSSQHDLSSVIRELHWIQLTVVVLYLEVISILFIVMVGKEGNMQLSLCLQRAVEFSQAIAWAVYLSACLLWSTKS